MKKRTIEQKIFEFLMFGSSLLISMLLFSIIFIIIKKGISAVSYDMIFSLPRGGFYLGKEGGILNAIVGSLILSGSAALLSAAISIPIAAYIHFYLPRKNRFQHFLRIIFDVLSGIPSIVYGALGFSMIIFLGLRVSVLAGIITVTIMISPIIIRGIDEIFAVIHEELIESGYALGFTKSEIAFGIVLRQSWPGITTTVLIGFGRAIGDAAAVIFTAGFSDYIPTALNQPAATLPLSIFFQLTSPIPEVQQRSYASAFTLTIIILAISGLSRCFKRKLEKYTLK